MSHIHIAGTSQSLLDEFMYDRSTVSLLFNTGIMELISNECNQSLVDFYDRQEMTSNIWRRRLTIRYVRGFYQLDKFIRIPC